MDTFIFFSRSFSYTKGMYFSMVFFSNESFNFYWMNTFVFYSRSFPSSTRGMYFSMVFFLWWKFRFLLNGHIHFYSLDTFLLLLEFFYKRYVFYYGSFFLWWKFLFLLNEHIHFLLSKLSIFYKRYAFFYNFFPLMKVLTFTSWKHSCSSLKAFLLQKVCIFLGFFFLWWKFWLLLNEHIHSLLEAFLLLPEFFYKRYFFFYDESFNFYWMNTLIYFSWSYSSSTRGINFSTIYFL